MEEKILILIEELRILKECKILQHYDKRTLEDFFNLIVVKLKTILKNENETTKIEDNKSAKELFEDLGYKIVKNDDNEIKYEDIGNEDLNIIFFKKHKVVLGMPTYDYFCDIPLLKAINKQMAELEK